MIREGDRVTWISVKTKSRSQGVVKFLMGDRARVQLPSTGGHLVNVPVDRLEVAE
jgi:hypothetical protein